MGVTKTDFMRGMQCPRMLWLDKHHPEYKVIPPLIQKKLDKGNEFGDEAMGMFGAYEEMTVFKPGTTYPDKKAMVLLTQEHIEKSTPVICDSKRLERSLGTLGGGNHFIEIDRAEDGTQYLVIHSGSRNLGKQVAEYYQNLAVELNKGKEEYFAKRDALIAEYKAAGRRTEIQAALKQLHWNSHEATIPEDLCFVYGQYLEDYLHDVEICQRFAQRSRELMAEIILERTGLSGTDAFHTIHNYIDTHEMILRKGSIAAHEGEKVLIPINMRDGSVLAVGKGNPEWNFSAPHGAGRIMSRTKAKESLDLDEYRKAMEGIYTTSVNENTIDEAPMAYKSLEDIIDVIRESVDVIEVLKPIYNFKAN